MDANEEQMPISGNFAIPHIIHTLAVHDTRPDSILLIVNVSQDGFYFAARYVKRSRLRFA